MSDTSSTKPQIHHSMMTMLSNCPEQFRRRYGARFGIADHEEIIKPGFAAAVGTAVDHSVNYIMRERIEKPDFLPTQEQCKDIAGDNARAVWQEGVLLTEEEAQQVKQVEASMIEWTRLCSVEHLDVIASDIVPTDVQSKWVIELPDYPVDLAGTIDIVEATQLRDTKTTGNMSIGNNCVQSLQGVMYSVAMQVKTGKLPEHFIYDYLIRKALKRGNEVVYKQFAIQPKPHWSNMILQRIENICSLLEAVKRGKAKMPGITPGVQNSWVCSPKYCGYWNTCKMRLDW